MTKKTAEAAKVIENTQRDLNIALMNELSLIFRRAGINTREVLEAAGTKWNFLRFTPGLVGGHCIGVDPYYLVHKAKELGYHPQIIDAGRRVNDFMPEFVAEEVVKGLIQNRKLVQKAKVLIMGLTFKENVADMRNSKISGTIDILKEYGLRVTGFDPTVNTKEATNNFGIRVISKLKGKYDVVIIAQNHRQFEKLGVSDFLLVASNNRKKLLIYDIKSSFPTLKKSPEILYRSL